MKSMVDGKMVTLTAAQANAFTSLWETPASVPILTKLHKGELWRRLTEQEAIDLRTALDNHPSIRIQEIFKAVDYLDTNDVDYPTLKAGVVAVLGNDRAEEVLTPDH